MSFRSIREGKKLGFSAKLYLAFSGLALIFVMALASALYLSDQLGKAVDRTTGELIPMTSVALSLSERSAILVASASGLVLSVDISILQQRSERLDALLREIDNSVLYLEQHASHLVTGQLRQDVRTLADRHGERSEGG